METIYATLIVLGFFLLRLAIPLIVVLVVGYMLHRLDAKWEAEAVTHRQLLVSHSSR